jgi:hypothetical protein
MTQLLTTLIAFALAFASSIASAPSALAEYVLGSDAPETTLQAVLATESLPVLAEALAIEPMPERYEPPATRIDEGQAPPAKAKEERTGKGKFAAKIAAFRAEGLSDEQIRDRVAKYKAKKKGR